MKNASNDQQPEFDDISDTVLSCYINQCKAEAQESKFQNK